MEITLDRDYPLDVDEVPDPYYGGADGFAHVWRLVDAASEAFLERVAR